MSARFGPFKALACQHFSFFRSGPALQRKSFHHLRRSGSTLMTASRDELAEMLKC